MTAHQYGTLKFIYENDTYINKECKTLHMGTLASLWKRGWIYRTGALLLLTSSGIQEYNKYKRPQANYRQHEGELSEHVKSLLNIGKLLNMKKAG